MGLGLGLGLGLANHGVAKRAVACFGRCESKHGVVRGRVVVGARAAHRAVGQDHVRVHHERRAPGPAPPAAAMFATLSRRQRMAVKLRRNEKRILLRTIRVCEQELAEFDVSEARL